MSCLKNEGEFIKRSRVSGVEKLLWTDRNLVNVEFFSVVEEVFDNFLLFLNVLIEFDKFF